MSLEQQFKDFLELIKDKREFKEFVELESMFKTIYENESRVSEWPKNMFPMSGSYYYLGKDNQFQGFMYIEDNKIIGRSYEPDQFMDQALLLGVIDGNRSEFYFVKLYLYFLAVPVFYHAIRDFNEQAPEKKIYRAIWNFSNEEVIAPINDHGDFLINTKPETEGTAYFCLVQKEESLS